MKSFLHLRVAGWFWLLLMAPVLEPISAWAAIDYPPTISWIADQRSVTAGSAIGPLGFTVGDNNGIPAGSLVVTASSSNPTLLPNGSITLGGSGANRTISLAPAASQYGLATVTLTVSDGTTTASTSFTLTVAAAVSGQTPPLIGGVAGTVIPENASYGPEDLVVEDDQVAAGSLTLTANSSNTALVPTSNIVFGGTSYGRNVTVTPAKGQTGQATITLTVSDGTNTSSTSFVVSVVASDTPPTLTAPGNQLVPLGYTPATLSFTVGDAETAPADLLVTAVSSNTNLLTNSGIVLGGSDANRTVTLTPQPGVTGAARITLSVTDTALTTSQDFLFVVYDPSSPSDQFQRPRGVFILDSPNGGTYTTTFGEQISLRDGNIENLPFVDGFTLRVSWNDVEGGEGQYDFYLIANLLNKLPAGQKLSIIIGDPEPAYIASTPGVTTWVDTSTTPSTTRAVPWDPFLQARYNAMVQAMAAYMVNGTALGQNPTIMMLNPYMPGGYTGFRDPEFTQLQSLPGYSRPNVLNAGENTVLAWQNNFPGKMVQFGFWQFNDTENAQYNGTSAWQWVQQQFLSVFNGTTQPRVGFFMENMAANRPGPGINPYTGSPPATFLAPEQESQGSTWNGFQMLGNFTRPFNNQQVPNMLNGTPADAMEYAFSNFGAEYFEIYITDILNSAMQPDLTLWHQFFQTAITTDTPPTLAGINNQTMTSSGTLDVTLSMGDAQIPASALVVTASSSNLTLVPSANIAITGTGATRTLVVTPVTGQVGTTTITVTVTGPGGVAATQGFSITVTVAGDTGTPTMPPWGIVILAVLLTLTAARTLPKLSSVPAANPPTCRSR